MDGSGTFATNTQVLRAIRLQVEAPAVLLSVENWAIAPTIGLGADMIFGTSRATIATRVNANIQTHKDSMRESP